MSNHTFGINVSDYDSEWPILKILFGSLQSITSIFLILFFIDFPLLIWISFSSVLSIILSGPCTIAERRLLLPQPVLPRQTTKSALSTSLIDLKTGYKIVYKLARLKCLDRIYSLFNANLAIWASFFFIAYTAQTQSLNPLLIYFYSNLEMMGPNY